MKIVYTVISNRVFTGCFQFQTATKAVQQSSKVSPANLAKTQNNSQVSRPGKQKQNCQHKPTVCLPKISYLMTNTVKCMCFSQGKYIVTIYTSTAERMFSLQLTVIQPVSLYNLLGMLYDTRTLNL